MENALLVAGLACLIAAVVGGGLKAFQIEIPALASPRRQALLAVLGAAFLTVPGGLWQYLFRPPPPRAVMGPLQQGVNLPQGDFSLAAP